MLWFLKNCGSSKPHPRARKRGKTGNVTPKLPVPVQNLKPHVLMMQAAEDWYHCDAADLLRRPKIWSIFLQ